MTEPVLEIESLSLKFGDYVATDDVSLDVRPGEVHALIGPNGAGKSTLVNLAAGNLRPLAGRISIRGRDVTNLGADARARAGLARSYQITQLYPTLTVLDNLMLATQARFGPSARLWMRQDRSPGIRRDAEAILGEVALDHRARHQVSDLSHGEKRQLEFAMCLALRPDVLLLDEPMAGMGTQDGQKIMRLLQRHSAQFGTLLIEHDMDAVFALADRLSVLVRGRIIATGTPDEIRRDPEVRRAYLGDH